MEIWKKWKINYLTCSFLSLSLSLYIYIFFFFFNETLSIIYNINRIGYEFVFKWHALSSYHMKNGSFHFDCLERKKWEKEIKYNKNKGERERERERRERWERERERENGGVIMLYIRHLLSTSKEWKERKEKRTKGKKKRKEDKESKK